MTNIWQTEGYKKIGRWLFGSRVKSETLRRKEFLLNVFLLGAVAVSFVNNAVLLYYRYRLGENYKGAPPIITMIFFCLFVVMFILLKRGWVRFISYGLLLIFWLIALGLMFISGVENQVALLFWAFVITMGSILVEIRYWWWIFWLMILSIILVLFGQLSGRIVPYLGWKEIVLGWEDGVAYLTVLFVIALSSWLFNRELTKSLDSLKKSQGELKKERDLLEVRVEQRTKELKKTQIEQISQLSKFIEYGRSMSGLLHDLVNPITAISLNLKYVDLIKNKESRTNEITDCTKRALRAAEKMQAFIVSSKNQLREKRDIRQFSIKNEIEEIIDLFIYKFRQEEIDLRMEIEDLNLEGDPAKFDQIVSNLLANAVDSFEKNRDEKKIILIKVNSFNNTIQLSIHDNGSGMTKEVKERIFDEFFTTKKEKKGVGIGLTIIKHIVEDDFGGTIEVESEYKKGTIFYVAIPNKQRLNCS